MTDERTAEVKLEEVRARLSALRTEVVTLERLERVLKVEASGFSIGERVICTLYNGKKVECEVIGWNLYGPKVIRIKKDGSKFNSNTSTNYRTIEKLTEKKD